jgi:hypothetical protein
MKKSITLEKSFYTPNTRYQRSLLIFACLFLLMSSSQAQQDSSAPVTEAASARPKPPKPVKNTFQSIWIIDNQTTMVPVKGTLEMDINHRFGTMNNGYDDFWGLFANSNIRLAMNYVPIKNLNVGFGITKSNSLWDINAKYAIITQTKGIYPVNVSYYVNAAVDTRDDAVIYDGTDIKHYTDRFVFFNQLLISRKFSEKFSVQVAPSMSHQNAVSGFYTKNDSSGKETYTSMEHNHFAVAVSARFKLTQISSLIFNYDQPLTKHPSNNPNPNISLGFEFNTSNHTFQVFAGNYYYLNPQRNNMYNHNSPFSYTDKATGEKVKGGQFLIGFNITRLWNY